MAAGSLSVLSPLSVIIFWWVLEVLSWFSRWKCSFFLSFSLLLISPLLLLSPFAQAEHVPAHCQRVHSIQMKTLWPQLHVSLPSFWAQNYSGRPVWRHRVAKGVSPSDSFELFLSLKWHHRGSAWLMSPHLYTLFYPECQLNIWKLGTFQSAPGQVRGCLIGNQFAIQPFQLSM